MKMSLGEIADRFSIVKLKMERSNVDCQKEYEELKKELDLVEEIYEYVERLYEVNGKIWSLESDIRKGKEGELGFEEVGRRAIQIRDHNGNRVQIKNEINSRYGTGYIEKKVDHASQK